MYMYIYIREREREIYSPTITQPPPYPTLEGPNRNPLYRGGGGVSTTPHPWPTPRTPRVGTPTKQRLGAGAVSRLCAQLLWCGMYEMRDEVII